MKTAFVQVFLLLGCPHWNEPDCWKTYWKCVQPAEADFGICVSPCEAKRDKATRHCRATRENCRGIRDWVVYFRCLTGPVPVVFYYLHYEVHHDDEHQVDWLEQVITPVGQPYECHIQCDSDDDGDVDLFDVAQAFAYSPIRNCVARGDGTHLQCEGKFRK